MAPRTFLSLIFGRLLVLATSAFCAEQPDSAVRFSQQNRVFRIDAGETTYAFGVNEKNELQSIYWGGRLSDDDTLPSPKAAHAS
jgi:alpha-galactosidase